MLATQIVQRIDVSAHAALIDAGQFFVSAEAYFNVPDYVSAAGAGITIVYVDEGPFGANIALSNSIAPDANASGVLDSDPLTWEPFTITNAPVPAGTRSLLVQLAYDNDSLGGFPGYVDAASLSVTKVPEPSACFLASTALLGLISRRYR